MVNETTEIENITYLIKLFKSRWPTESWKENGFFTDDYLLLVNPHWLKFPPPSEKSHYILALLYVVIMTIGVSGNVLVIFMFLKCRSLRTPANILVMNLAVSDCVLLIKMPLFIYNSLQFGPALGDIGCSIYGFLGGLTGTASIMTLAAIAVDRYNVIVYPLVRKTRQRIHVYVLLIWLYGGFFATIPLLNIGLNRYVPEGFLTSCSFDYLSQERDSKIMIIVFFTAAWVVPFSIITVCYLGICRVVMKARDEPTDTDSSRHYRESAKRKSELKLAGVVIGVIGLWFISWTPYAVVALLGVSGNERYITPLSSMIPALFCKLASCIDPFVYAVTHPRFRLEVKSIIRKTSRRRLEKKQLKVKKCWTVEENQGKGSVDEVEEMIVMVDLSKVRNESFTSWSDDETTFAGKENSGIKKNRFEDFVLADFRTQPPSWFASPYYTNSKTKRATSLRIKTKLKDVQCLDLKEPISI